MRMILATGSMLGLLLAGCGDDDMGGETEGATSAPTTGTATDDSTGEPNPDTTGPEPGTSTGEPGSSSGEPGSTSLDSDSGSSSSGSETDSGVSASAVIMGLGDDASMGSAVFTQEGTDVTLVIELTGVEPAGLHGIHIHEVGDCSAADGSSAGGHWNPDGNMHGMLGMGESHLGDLGNIDIDDTGAGTLMITTDQWTIDTGDDTDVVGRGIILHVGEDDLSPSPDPGARIACGEVALDG